MLLKILAISLLPFCIECGAGSNTKTTKPPPPAEILFCGATHSVAETRKIICTDSSVTDLSPLAHLQKLEHLQLSGLSKNACASDLRPLSGLLNLKTLTLSHMPVSDIRPLAKLAALKSLDIAQTKVTDLLPLANLTNLTTLIASETEVSSVAPLSQLASIVFLDISRTKVDDLRPLSKLQSLVILDISQTKVDDLRPLSNLTRLEKLLLVGLDIDDLAPVAVVRSIVELHIPWIQISLTPLLDLDRLRILYVSKAKISPDDLLSIENKLPDLKINPPIVVYLDGECGKNGVSCSTRRRPEMCSEHIVQD